MKQPEPASLDEVLQPPFRGFQGRALLKRVLGDDLVERLKSRTAPLEIAALRESIRRHGFRPDEFSMSDEQAGIHFANDTEVGPFSRLAIRFFHEYKLQFLRAHLAPDYVSRHAFIEVGDSDGLVLRSLGKGGFSINNDPRCIALIGQNGIESRLGLGERLDVLDKSYDVAMTFQTLEHSLNPVAFLQELTRVARQKVIVSVPGVTRTMIHPRINGVRVGEEHVFELCMRDLLRLTTHLPLRPAHYARLSMFAPPGSSLARAYYLCHRNPELFVGCHRWFDFYIFDVDETDRGVSVAESAAIYGERR